MLSVTSHGASSVGMCSLLGKVHVSDGSRAKQPDLWEPLGLVWTLLMLARLIESFLKLPCYPAEIPYVLCLKGLYQRELC